MLGRYHLLRLHPFSVGEVLRNFAEPLNGPPRSAADWLTLGQDRKDVDSQPTWERLLRRSGFPEPFLKGNDLYHQRWALRRKDLVLREDIRDISNIRTLDMVEELAELLPSRIGGPLSINSLREDLQVAFDTVKAWIETLERLYYCYRIPPFSLRISRSLSKEQKLYLWDWSEIRSPAARFENAVASHLLKSVHFWRDLGFGDYDLLYWRNREKREIDFIITLGREPIVAIECKLSDSDLTDNFNPFSAKFPLVPRIQLVADPGIRKISKNALVTTASRWLADLV